MEIKVNKKRGGEIPTKSGGYLAGTVCIGIHIHTYTHMLITIVTVVESETTALKLQSLYIYPTTHENYRPIM